MPRAVTRAERFADGIDLYDWLPDGSGFVAVATLPPEETPGDRRRRLELYGDVRRFPAPSSKPSFFRVALDGMTVDRLGEAPFDQPETLAVSPDGAWMAASGSAEEQTTAGAELVLLPLGAPGGALRRFSNDIWEESLAWSGRELFVAGPGERRDGVQHNTEGRLYRLGEPERLVRLHPELPGYVKQLVPLPGGAVLLTDNLSTRMRILRVQAGADPVTLLDHRGWIFNLSASRDGKTVAFVAADSTHYPEIYLARGDLTGIRPVTRLNEALTRAPLPEIETFTWDDGAGGTVEGALFWPPGRKGEKGLPLIVDLHGGPFSVARTEAVSLAGSFLSYPALLAARGFLVLNPNYRGSAGRGDAFTQGIEGHHCSRPSEDVIRGVESLVARGQADRGRLGLMGYSGGGGLSKCLIGRTRMFRAVATGSGVWNDIATFTSKRGALWTESFYPGSSPWTDFSLWWKESPMSGLDQVETPTLILAGERDGDAPRQAEELYRGLTRRGVPTELLLFPGEGHVFQRPSHKRTKMRAEISWLEHHLLGTPRP
ncbi:MAG TPA: hypothetical protein DD490_20040 [Acidobacteria bacterium]|nr:hypothetical protein [Acidobacteriota bacterium]